MTTAAHDSDRSAKRLSAGLETITSHSGSPSTDLHNPPQVSCNRHRRGAFPRAARRADLLTQEDRKRTIQTRLITTIHANLHGSSTLTRRHYLRTSISRSGGTLRKATAFTDRLATDDRISADLFPPDIFGDVCEVSYAGQWRTPELHPDYKEARDDYLQARLSMTFFESDIFSNPEHLETSKAEWKREVTLGFIQDHDLESTYYETPSRLYEESRDLIARWDQIGPKKGTGQLSKAQGRAPDLTMVAVHLTITTHFPLRLHTILGLTVAGRKPNIIIMPRIESGDPVKIHVPGYFLKNKRPFDGVPLTAPSGKSTNRARNTDLVP